ncbi:MAG: hypothetical protein IJF33_05210 [Clostridia bacterium]|nr:hypothetical protein [Clostridia bacterium]
MTFRELFENALRTIAESPTDSDTSDYEERASYILATFCTECSWLDRQYRRAHGIADATTVSPTYVELSENIPFCEVFASASVYYLCAMLTMDENESMSERFFELYTDVIVGIQASIPSVCEPIADRYGMI